MNWLLLREKLMIIQHFQEGVAKNKSPATSIITERYKSFTNNQYMDGTLL